MAPVFAGPTFDRLRAIKSVCGQSPRPGSAANHGLLRPITISASTVFDPCTWRFIVSQKWTVSAIAKELRVERHRVAWIIASHNIPHQDFIGSTRVFDDDAVAAIRAHLSRIDASKTGVSRGE